MSRPLPAALLLARNGETVSLQQAVRRVEQRTDGRVLAARTVRRPDGTVHLIRVLVGKGRVRVFTVDAGTGEIR